MGSFVCASSGEQVIYGIVANVATVSIDPARRVMALGATIGSEELLRREHPELEQLLRTDFTVLTLGYREGRRTWQRLPPVPPQIHAFVRVAAEDEVKAFTSDLGFLATLLRNVEPGGDEALAAALRRAAECHGEARIFLVKAGRELARLLASDGQRLQRVLGLLQG